MASPLLPRLESQGLEDSFKASDLVLNDTNSSGDSFSGNIAGELSLESQSGGQLESTAISSYYQNGTAESGDVLTWGVQTSWDGADYSLKGDFASDKYAFVIDSGVSNSTGDLNIHQTWAGG